MIKLLIFPLSSYYLAKYLKERLVSYLFIGSLLTALLYMYEPSIIFLMPFYASIFYLSCNDFCSKKRLSQLFVFVFPTAAAVFSLSYISWIYGRSFRFIYIKDSLFETAVGYSGKNILFYFLTNLSFEILFYLLIYISVLIWILYRKGFSNPNLYIYLMPVFFYAVKKSVENYNAEPSFYILYFLFAVLFFYIYKNEINISSKFVFYLFSFFNSLYLVYKIYLSLF